MIFDKVKHDFGIVKRGESRSVAFKIIDDEGVPFDLSKLRTTCSCTTPKFDKDKLELILGLKFDSLGNKSTTIYYNEFNKKPIEIALKGTVI